ncbi:hypothetical protein [Oceanobacillus jeddahense]|uniref:hypothetical protein n=1 Tax=Oceanobacillus jeddahense TaxID=1462527 RepID=UPI0036308AD8
MFWVVVCSLTGASLFASSITFLLGNTPSTFSAVITYAAFGLILIIAAVERRMEMPTKGLKNEYVKIYLDFYRNNKPLSTIEEYAKYLKYGALDGRFEMDGKEFEAIMWIADNVEKCEEYVKRSES